jgi:hypothetical protein
MAILVFLWLFVVFFRHSVKFVVALHMFSHFGMLRRETSGNPESDNILVKKFSNLHFVAFQDIFRPLSNVL